MEQEYNDNCEKGIRGCYCRVGWPYEKMCPDCRDTRDSWDNKSYCVCPPRDDICPPQEEDVGITLSDKARPTLIRRLSAFGVAQGLARD